MVTSNQLSLLNIISQTNMDRRRIWFVFRVFNFGRLVLVIILLGVFFLNSNVSIFGNTNPPLFLGTALTYVMAVIISIIGSYWRRPSLKVQAHLQTLVDLVALSLLIYASGGIVSNLSILLVTVIAAGGILLPLYSALASAALAFFILVGFWFYEALAVTSALNKPDGFGQILDYLQNQIDHLGRLGILGASFFITALLTYTLAERNRRSEELAYQRSKELLELAELNQAIVQHLQSGIIVVDRFARIKLMNDTAYRLLDYQESVRDSALSEVSTVLQQRLKQWLTSGLEDAKPFRSTEHSPDLIVHFNRLTGSPLGDLLLSLEDSAHVAQRLQEIKLAALGRMTAGIAHEIRNPLTSISHAAQLLHESETVSANDHRLAQIIHDNTKRANKIIAKMLDLSRRDRLRPKDLPVQAWLDNFRQEFLQGQGNKIVQLNINVQPKDLVVRFDPIHLQQVLWNLCSNACIHGTPSGQIPKISLTAGLNIDPDTAFIEVQDFGPGIAESETKKIFEPFFTTKTQGTGLGLYIAREICEANGAHLQYTRSPESGSCFRITLAKSAYQEEDSPWKLAMH